MLKYLSIYTFLLASLYATKVSCTPIFNNDIADLFNSEEDATSHPVVDTDDSSPTTTQLASVDSSSDIPNSSSTTDLPSSSSTENIENAKPIHRNADAIDWKFAFLSFSLMILLVFMCKFCTYCIPNLCEMCLDQAETRTIQEREQETAPTVENRCKTCHERISHRDWPYAHRNCAIVTVLELEPISEPVLAQNLASQIMSFPIDNEAFIDDIQSSSVTDRAQRCETPPPPYSSTVRLADDAIKDGVNTLD